MKELELTLGHVAAMWWLYTWRVGVGVFVFALVAGVVFGVAFGLAGVPREFITPVGTVLGFVLGVGWSVVGIVMMLKKRYRDFRIALLPAN